MRPMALAYRGVHQRGWRETDEITLCHRFEAELGGAGRFEPLFMSCEKGQINRRGFVSARSFSASHRIASHFLQTSINKHSSPIYITVSRFTSTKSHPSKTVGYHKPGLLLL